MNLHIVLVAPEIPQNTGNIGRLCVALDARLHLVRPLGFSVRHSQLRRAGLDYWEHLNVTVHNNWEAFLLAEHPERMLFLSTRGSRSYLDQEYREGDVLVFGNESSGLPPEFYSRYAAGLRRIPMPGPHVRSLNLATAAGIVAYEAFRQIQPAQAPPGPHPGNP